ncbi:phosphodiester glycosidase family protein [Cohnella caldifontis]|uniref:phosphodiester glycosidase family protein n=1 Tax=Cohnella caldifontis TaxID=3027471 RepID=UPI0023ED7B6D|nr:phosphodiester glycosidase family protein [Cohnella sp. YIM B05605]
MFTKFRGGFWLFFCLAAGFLAAVCLYGPALADFAGQAGDSLPATAREWDKVREDADGIGQSYGKLDGASDGIGQSLEASRTALAGLIERAESEKKDAELHKRSVDGLLSASGSQKQQASDTLEQVLAGKLGDPIGQTFGQRATIKVYSLKEAGYRGYMAKVKLHDPKAVKLVLAQDEAANKGETTSHAAARSGAKLAINGGGFAKQNGLLYPIGITVVDGEIRTFNRTDMSFIGFDKAGKLVGGELKTKEEVQKLNVVQGASFVPTLLEDAKKRKIPSKWANKREPRTLIGNFSNGDLLLIVIDGRQKGYSNGVTLEEAQSKLLEWGVRDAYTLDGGGSSTFYYNGKVLNSPSDGRQRLVASNFVVLP